MAHSYVKPARRQHVEPSVQVAHHDAIGAVAAHAERVEAAGQPQHLQRHPARGECLQTRTRRLDHVQPRAARRERHAEGPAELARRMALAAEEAAQRVRRLQRVECLGDEKRCVRSGLRRVEGLGMHLGCTGVQLARPVRVVPLAFDTFGR